MFHLFKIKLKEQFKKLTDSNSKLFVTDIDKDYLWDLYLNSFPEGTNNVFKERREFDCTHCKQFIRAAGNVVAIKDNALISIWDIPNLEFPYNIVAKAMSEAVKMAKVNNIFISEMAPLGVDSNEQITPEGILTWQHFHYKLPTAFVAPRGQSVEAMQAPFRDSKNSFERALTEISTESIEVVLELISQDSLYKGIEYKHTLESFQTSKNMYNSLVENKDLYVWTRSLEVGPAVAKIRGSSIGTLLTDISEGMELDAAVASYEAKVAPSNYKRTSSVISKRQIEAAQKTLEELNLVDSLERRHALPTEITINNVLFVDRDTKPLLKDVFDELKQDVKVSEKSFNKVEEIGIEDFIKNILPTSKSLEVFMANSHTNNLMSLIAPVQASAAPIFKWNNNFSWAYNNDVTDSIKESVKTRGGKVDGVLRFSIMWAENQPSDNSDLDAHCNGPERMHIYYSHLHDIASSGRLDVDITAPNSYQNKNIVENITWPNLASMPDGDYHFSVHGFSIRGEQKGFTAEIEFNGEIHQFTCDKPVRTGEYVTVAKVNLKKGVFTLTAALPSTTSSKDIWGIKTNTFQKVNMMLLSPNFWDGQTIGNKHYFFVVENCLNPLPVRGFYNEFLKDELTIHRKVFEILGNKMKAAPSPTQLSGLGFSTTQRNNLIVRVTGTFSRILKINF